MEQTKRMNIDAIKFAARSFSLLCHPTRKSIVILLVEKDFLNSEQIVKLLPAIYDGLSGHLLLLLKYNIVSKARGYYSLNIKTIEKIIEYSDELCK